MIDFCFDQLLELISELNEKKAQHLGDLYDICMRSANVMINGCVYVKKIESFVNKLFKMADGYVNEANAAGDYRLRKNWINSSFNMFKKKKEQQRT